MDWAGIAPQVETGKPPVSARLREGDQVRVLWIVGLATKRPAAPAGPNGTASHGPASWDEAGLPSGVTVADRGAFALKIQVRGGVSRALIAPSFLEFANRPRSV